MIDKREGGMVSIVIPVHDTGECIKECIDSIIRQSFSNWELILVDDASMDVVTRNYLKEYCYSDKRIKCFRSENRIGAAMARNKGLELAKGEYIIFLDSDDVFFPDMIGSMLSALEIYQADLCLCDFSSFDDESGEIWETDHLIHVSGITDRPFNIKELGERGLLHWWMSPWEMLCRRILIDENKIKFQDLPCCNDVFYGVMCSQRAGKIVYAGNGKPLMKYRTGREKSISSSRHPEYAYKAVQAVSERIDDHNSMEYRQLMVFLVECSMILFFRYEKDDAEEYYCFLRNYIARNIDLWNIKEEDSIRRIHYFLDNEYETGWFKKLGDGGAFW